MASQNPNPRTSIYPQVNTSNPHLLGNHKSFSQSSIYPHIDKRDLFPNKDDNPYSPSAPPVSVEEIILTVPGVILHLIDKHYSIELACGDLTILRLSQGDNTIAVFAAVANEIQWPLAKDEPAVKLDTSHYFFTIKSPDESNGSDSDDDDKPVSRSRSRSRSAKYRDLMLNYGLTIASKGQEKLLQELDFVLETYSGFSVQKVKGKGLDELIANEFSADDLKTEKKEVMEDRCRAYWTTLAPNVEDYSGLAAKLIAAGSGQLVKGILWCGDVTLDRLKWGNQVFEEQNGSKTTEKVALGLLSGVVKVSGFFTTSLANSRMGKKFFGLLPGEVVLASLDGFSKVCDAVEIAGKNVMSTSSTVTTELVSQRYGEEAAKATSEGLDAAGHAVGTAWTVFKIRKAINPKSVLKPGSLAKSAAETAKAELKAKKSKK